MNVQEHNRIAWDSQVVQGNMWTIPVSDTVIAAARGGEWAIYLTPSKPVPQTWFPPLRGLRVLCLASGGGQQGPILAAAGAEVTVFDNSSRQLEQDRRMAERHALDIRTMQGDMADLSAFADASFDLIVHPVSNVFAPEVRPVWREAYRVLQPGGTLLSGIVNPIIYLFDMEAYDRGVLEVKYALPYSDADTLTDEEKARWLAEGRTLEFGHILEDLIGGQIDAGFVITGFFEDRNREGCQELIDRYTAHFIATRAVKGLQ